MKYVIIYMKKLKFADFQSPPHSEPFSYPSSSPIISKYQHSVLARMIFFYSSPNNLLVLHFKPLFRMSFLPFTCFPFKTQVWLLILPLYQSYLSISLHKIELSVIRFSLIVKWRCHLIVVYNLSFWVKFIDISSMYISKVHIHSNVLFLIWSWPHSY